MKKAVLVLMFVLFASALGFSTPGNVDAIIFPLESDIYENMDALYALLGLSRPTTNRPWSEAQARKILSEVDSSGLEGVAKRLYEELDEEINDGLRWKFGDDFQLDVRLETAFEGYAHTNTEEFVREDDWERSYNERKSLMRAVFEFTGGDIFYTTADIHYKWGRADYNDTFAYYFGSDRVSNDSYVGAWEITEDSKAAYVTKSYMFSKGLMTNFFLDTKNFGFIWPKRAVFSLGGDNWNVSVNRDVLSMGNAFYGNLLVDDHHFSDYFRLSIFGKIFTYDWVIMFLNTLVNNEESIADTETEMYFIHTLQFRILNKVTLTVSENVMFRAPAINFSYLNPAFIFHNLNNRSMFNALAYLELNAAIIPGLEIYGQFALDQARAPNEGDSQTGSWGAIAGLKHTAAIGNGVLTSYFEAAYTSPLLYRRDGVDFVRVYRYWSHTAKDGSFSGGHVPIFDFIGFPDGGDTAMTELRSTYRSLDNWDLSFFARGLVHGEVTLYTSHNTDGNNTGLANKRGVTPSGDNLEVRFITGIEANYDMEDIFRWPGVSFSGELDWYNRWDYSKTNSSFTNYQTDLQFTLGVSVDF